jgi:hypothetical protein
VVGRVAGLDDAEGGDEADVGGEELAVGEVGAGADAGAGAVGVVRGAYLGVVDEALGGEGEGVGEALGVVVGGPGVLARVSLTGGP